MTTMTTTFEPGALYHVPPGQLLLERNIREATPSAELIASVEQVGVLEPITAVLNDDGALVVRYGHRRTMAALAANLATCPVYVWARDDMSDEAEIERITCQRDENTHRVGLSAADEVGIVEQYTAFGMTAAQIAQQARVQVDTVKTAMAISGSKLAKKAAARYAELTLDQAAAVAEFDDEPELAKDLILCAVESPSQFPHAVQRQRDDRTRAAAKAEAIAKLTAAGVTVIDPPGWDGKTAKRLTQLVNAKTDKPVTLAQHKKCPGHVAWVINADPVYGCTNAAANGHRDTYSSGSSSRPSAGDMSDAEREKAKAERKLVIENNKAWDSAETVRRDWLALFARMKTPPKGAAAFIARALQADLHYLLDYQSNTLAGEWLSVDPADISDLAVKAPEARALHIALVAVLGRYEAKTSKADWRQNGGASQTGRYLRFLELAGYGLSEVEKFACSSKTV